MSDKIYTIKKQIQKECEQDKIMKGWWFEAHLLGVEKFAKELLRKFPKADKEVVMLGVWLHDLQRIHRIKGDHEKIGAREAVKVMKEYGYDPKTIRGVEDIILAHSCEKRMPSSLEGKILATADGMSHYYNDFFLKIAVLGQRDAKEYKKWLAEKLDRNYNRKLFFPFAKKKIKSRHELFKKLITMG